MCKNIMRLFYLEKPMILMSNKSINKKNKLVKIVLSLLIIIVVGFIILKTHNKYSQNKSVSFISASFSNNESRKHVVSLIINYCITL